MRTLTIVSLLALAAACEDRRVEVREASVRTPLPSTTESAGESTDPGPSPATSPGQDAQPDQDARPGELAEAESGLTVEVLDRGDGPAVHRGSVVRIHYEAWLDETYSQGGEPFDSSLSRLVPLEVRLGGSGPGLIEGLTRGLLGLHAGSRARIHVPADLGWGDTGNPSAGIAPDSDLVLEVRILSVR